MKKKYGLLLLVSTILFMTSGKVNAQGNKTTKDTLKVVKLKDGGIYKFTATNMYPMKGRSRNLTPNYELVFSKDTLSGNLPYMGEAYMADYGSRDGGVNLQTSDFTYTESTAKKQTYLVKYKVRGQDVSDAIFIIYKDGTADLQMIFLKRQGISYRGNVTKVNKLKKK
jgi:hypothetical protein